MSSPSIGPSLVIAGGDYAGRYPFVDPVNWTTREWGWVKRYAGYLPLTMDTGMGDGDAELLTVLALIHLRRSGLIDTTQIDRVWERLQDEPPFERITFDGGDEQPAPLASSSNENGGSSGPASITPSATSAPTPPHIGDPTSATSEHAPATSEN